MKKILFTFLIFVIGFALSMCYIQQAPAESQFVWQDVSNIEAETKVSENFQLMPKVDSGIKQEPEQENTEEEPLLTEEPVYEQTPPEEYPFPGVEEKSPSEWMDMELTDVSTGRKFRISDFKGKTVLLENFEMRCPSSIKQQDEMKKLRSREGNAIIQISLETCPYEDESRVRKYSETHGFGWYFAVAPEEFTVNLLKEFGTTAADAQSAPVLLICEDQSAKLLERRIKSDDELLSEIEGWC